MSVRLSLLLTSVLLGPPAMGRSQQRPRAEDPIAASSIAPRSPRSDETQGDQDSARIADDEVRTRDVPSERLEPRDGRLSSWLLGWGGVRQRLEDRGFDLEMLYTVDGSLFDFEDPGGDEDALVRGLFELIATYDTERGHGHAGGTFHVALQWFHGVDPTGRLAVLQPLSSIDSPRRFQVGRLWYEQRFDASRTHVRVGKIDANSQFAFVDAGGQFLHSSMGFSPSIFPMPSYPDAAFGATVVQPVGPLLGVRAGAFDGSFASGTPTGERGLGTLFDGSDEFFFLGEVDATWTSGRAAFGAWTNTADFERFDGGSENGTEGLYATFEQRLWRRDGTEEGGLAAFAQWGDADGAVTEFEEHLGLGLSWDDPEMTLAPRAGIGLSRVGVSDDPAAGLSADAETAYELYFGWEPLPWMRLKPTLQYVTDPGGDAARDDAWALTLRATLSI